MDTTYNGWKNRQTWNVSLWINNDEPLYRSAVAYMQKRKEQGKTGTYIGFVKTNWMSGDRTPDNIVDVSPFFRRLGGSETVKKGYTTRGYRVVEIISKSPDRTKKTIRSFNFDI